MFRLLYIDPGTGSMLFTILIGLLGAAMYFFRGLYMKLRFLLTGGKADKINDKKLPIVIFTDHKRYWNTFEPICDAFEERQQQLYYYTMSPDDPGLKKEYKYIKAEFIGEGNKAFARMNMLNATMVLSTTPSLDVFQWKRSKYVDYYVFISHAANDISGYRMFGIDYFDSIFLSGDYQIHQVRKLEEIRGLPQKELIMMGVPYMDEMLKRLQSCDPLPPHETTVLLAPSWGKSSILVKYGERFIDALINTGYHIIVRPHPQSYTSDKEVIDRLKEKYRENDHFEWNRDNDNFEVLRRSDIMISDFSGVIFDYTLVFDKPIVYADTSFDFGPYDYHTVNEPTWTFSTLPKLGLQVTEDNIENIKSIIDECLNNPVFKEGRDEARKETWVNIGKGTEITVDYLINKYNELVNKREEGGN